MQTKALVSAAVAVPSADPRMEVVTVTTACCGSEIYLLKGLKDVAEKHGLLVFCHGITSNPAVPESPEKIAEIAADFAALFQIPGFKDKQMALSAVKAA